MRIYKVTINTPLGDRNGTLGISVTGNMLDGFIQILKSSKPISGVIDNDGNCNFSGHFDTATETLYFKAVGSIKETAVELILHSEGCQYKMNGSKEKEDV